MASFMLVRHKVRDFSGWKSGYEAHLPKRLEAGLSERYLFHNADDPNEVLILFEAEDSGRAKNFAASADLMETMRRAGVVDKPDVFFLTN